MLNVVGNLRWKQVNKQQTSSNKEEVSGYVDN